MSARPTLQTLVNRVRTMIADDGTLQAQVFTDDTIQEYLDLNRDDVRSLRLTEVPQMTYQGPVLFLDFYSPVGGNWEEDEMLQNGSWKDVTADVVTKDRIVGKWTFATMPIWPIFITGKRFDLYGAAADLMELWASRLKLKFSFSSGNQRMELQQQMQAVLQMAAEFRAKAQPKSARISRDDMAN